MLLMHSVSYAYIPYIYDKLNTAVLLKTFIMPHVYEAILMLQFCHRVILVPNIFEHMALQQPSNCSSLDPRLPSCSHRPEKCNVMGLSVVFPFLIGLGNSWACFGSLAWGLSGLVSESL